MPYRIPRCRLPQSHNPFKYRLDADSSSGNLTIKVLDIDDRDKYHCTVISHNRNEILGSTSKQVVPLSLAGPYKIHISHASSSNYCNHNTYVTLIAGEAYDIICGAYWARPPAILRWRIPGDVTAVLEEQSVVVQDDFYNSRKTVTVTPSQNDDGKILDCFASHPEIRDNLQCSVHLSVRVLPSRMLLFQTKDEQKYESQPTVIYVQEDSPTSITCKTIASIPATELSWTVFGGREIILNNRNHVKNCSSLDNSLFDTESTIMIHPDTKTHGMSIQCNASMDKELVGTKTVQLIVYGPPHDVTMTFPQDVNDGIEINITCKAFNGYPAPLIHWYIGSRNVTDDSSQKNSLNVADRYNAESTLVLVPNTILDHRKRLLCQAVQPSLPLERSVNESIILNVSSLPVGVKMTIKEAVYNGMETNVTCKAVNGYPAPVIHWYIGSRNVTGHSSLKISVNNADRYDAESTLTFTPNRFDHGKRLLCQALQAASSLNISMNVSIILNMTCEY
nr:synaptogenesis protein syg-2-like [Lytechinus pictus]